MQSNVWALLATPERGWLLRQGELRYRLFSGTPVVEVSPAQWDLDPALIRQTAAARRYRETTPGLDGFLRFEFVPQLFGPPFDRPMPGTPESLRRLTRLITGQDQVWTSLRRLGVNRADVAEAAQAAGLRVVCEVADPTDRLLLLRRHGLDGELTSVPYRTQWYRRTERRLDQPFDGRPETPVPFSDVSTELLGEVASLYGYFYGGQYVDPRIRFQRVTGLFVKCRPGMFAGPRQEPPPTPRFDQAEERPGREQWLLNRISGEDDVWISVREAKLPRRRIAEIAAQEGLAISLEFADTADRVLKLSRSPAPMPAGKRRFRVSFLNFLLPAGWALCCLIPSAVISAVSGDSRVFVMGFGLAVLLAPAMMWALRVFPRSTRVGWLAREFNGANSVTFFVGPYGVSPELTVQIAEAHGYFFAKQSRTRAQGTFATFVKRP